MSKVNKVTLKNAPNYEDFVAILLNNGYTVITKLVSGGDQIEIQFYQEEQYAKGGVIPPSKKETPEEIFGKFMEELLERLFEESEE